MAQPHTHTHTHTSLSHTRLGQPVASSPRLARSSSFENRAAPLDPGSTLSFLSLPPLAFFFPLSRNALRPRARPPHEIMLAWYRSGLTRRTLLLRSARLVLVAPTATPMPPLPFLQPPSPSFLVAHLFLLLPRRRRRLSSPSPATHHRFAVHNHDAPAARRLSSRLLPPLPVTASLIQTCPT